MTLTFDRQAFIRSALKPGNVVIADGQMGDGKTHLAVAFAQERMENSEDPVYIITNIPFAKRCSSGWSRDYPENVFGATSMEQVFRKVRDLLSMHRFDEMTVILVLDEVQNFMGSDRYMSGIAPDINLFLANIRKFGMCAWFLTPTVKNVGPRIRGGKVDGTDGYCTHIFRKDMSIIRPYLASKGLTQDPRRFTTVQWKPGMKPWVMYVPAPSWTTPLQKLSAGEYAYDTGSVANFRMKDNDKFDLTKLLESCGEVVSEETHIAIDRYFTELDGGETDDEDRKFLDNRDEALDVDRMRSLGLTWDEIGYVKRQNKEAVRYRYTTYFAQNPTQKLDTASIPVDSGKKVSRARRVRERESVATQSSEKFFPSGKVEGLI